MPIITQHIKTINIDTMTIEIKNAQDYIKSLDAYGEGWSNDNDALVDALEDYAKISHAKSGCMIPFVKKDKHGNEIREGRKFRFKYLKELHNPIELIGSFEWNDDELRYEIDIHDSDEYVCLSYVGCGIMFDFEIL